MDSPIIYRCFFNRRERQFVDSSHIFESIKAQLKDKGVNFRQIEDNHAYLPVQPTMVEQLRRQGIMIAPFEGNNCLCIRQLVLDVYSTEFTEEQIDEFSGYQMTSLRVYQDISFNREF